jgi:hypothetical protein
VGSVLVIVEYQSVLLKLDREMAVRHGFVEVQ